MIECPKCKTPFTPPYFVSLIEYPKHVTYIFDLIEGRFNVNTCPVCKEKVYVKTGFIVLNTQEKKAIVYNMDKGKENRMEELNDFDVLFAENVAEGNAAMMKWMYTTTDQIEAAIEAAKNENYQVIATPFQLRLLLSASNGYTNFNALINGKPVNTKEYYKHIIKQQIIAVLENCSKNNNLLNFFDEIQKAILPDCFTPAVLKDFSDNLKEWDEKDNWKELQIKWCLEYANAVIHLVSNTDNPRKETFTVETFQLWNFHFNQKFEKDLRFLLLNKRQGQLLLDFKVLFDIYASRSNETKNSRELIDKFRTIMKFYGWGDKFSATMADRLKIQGTFTAQQVESVASYIVNEVVKKTKFNDDSFQASAIGGLIQPMVKTLLSTNQPKIAKRVVEKMLEVSEQNNDYMACIDVCVQSVKSFNYHRLISISEYLILLVTEKYKPWIAKIPPDLYFDFMIEAGNTFRYSSKLEMALTMYETAKKFLEIGNVHSTEKLKKEAAVLIDRNLAIIYRDLNQLSKAEDVLKKIVTEYPHNFEITTNLVMLYFKINEYEKIIELLAPFSNSTDLTIRDAVVCKSIQAVVNKRLGREKGSAGSL